MKFKSMIFLIGMFLFTFPLWAQQNSSDPVYTVQYVPTGQVENTIDTLYSVTLQVRLQNISNTSKIHVKIKSMNGGAVLHNLAFPLETGQSLPQGTQMQVQGNDVQLSLGVHNPVFYNYELQSEDKTGNRKSIKRQ